MCFFFEIKLLPKKILHSSFNVSGFIKYVPLKHRFSRPNSSSCVPINRTVKKYNSVFKVIKFDAT